MIVNALASLALAGPPTSLSPEPSGPSGLVAERQAPTDVRVAVRGLVDMRHDAFLASRYGTGGVGAALGVVVPLVGALSVDVEFGYSRAGSSEGGESTLQLLPATFLAELAWVPSEDRGLELFAGAGPALTMWSESGQDPDWMAENAEDPTAPQPTVLRGARPGLEVRAGLRVNLGLVQQSLDPIPSGPVKAIELEVLVARRLATHSSGFDLNSWRAGVGVAFRF